MGLSGFTVNGCEDDTFSDDGDSKCKCKTQIPCGDDKKGQRQRQVQQKTQIPCGGEKKGVIATARGKSSCN